MSSKIDYRVAALAAGWAEMPNDPTGEADVGPCLYHAAQDRVWPLNDPKGACADLGILNADGSIDREAA